MICSMIGHDTVSNPKILHNYVHDFPSLIVSVRNCLFLVTPGITKKEYRDRRHKLLRFLLFIYCLSILLLKSHCQSLWHICRLK